MNNLFADMSKLRLPSWKISSARNAMPELLAAQHNRAGWVGSVSCSDAPRLAQCTSKAEEGDIEALMQYSDMEGELLYAVLLNINRGGWKLVLIQSPESMMLDEQVMFSKNIQISDPVGIYEFRNPEIDGKIHQIMNEACKVRFRDVLKYFVR